MIQYVASIKPPKKKKKCRWFYPFNLSAECSAISVSSSNYATMGKVGVSIRSSGDFVREFYDIKAVMIL